MKFLNELLTNKSSYKDDPNELDADQIVDDTEDDDTFPGDEEQEDNLGGEEDILGDGKEGQEDPEGLNPDDKGDIKDVVDKVTENPDKQGAIRVVPRSHLVFKRQSKDGTYEELWMYKNEDMKKALNTRRDIISGTDIPVNKSVSDDAKQSYTIWSVGDIEMLNITGLPN